MPQIVEDPDWGPPRSEYPWEQWLENGVTKVYVREVDFTVSPRDFASTLRRAAWRLGFQAQITRTSNTVTARPYPRDDEGWRKQQRQRADLEESA